MSSASTSQSLNTIPGASRPYWPIFKHYLLPQWRWSIVLALLLLGNIALQLIVPQIIRHYIDVATTSGVLAAVTRAAVLYISFTLLQQVTSVAAQYVGQVVAWTSSNALRDDLVLHCLKLDMTFYHSHSSGELIERIDGDVTNLESLLSDFVFQVLGNGLLILGILIMMILVDWRLGLAMMAFSIISMVALGSMRGAGVTEWQAQRQASADISGFLVEHLSATEDLRGNGATDYALGLLPPLLKNQVRATRRAILVGSATRFTTMMLFAVANIIAFGIGAYLFQRHRITLGTLYLIFTYTEILVLPLQNITEQLTDWPRASASIRRVNQLLHTQSDVPDQPRRPVPTSIPSVQFSHVSFGYQEDLPVLRDISFDLPAGHVLGILGRTGSGKTTMTRLLFRLYDPRGGVIRLGGTDIREIGIAELRRHIGLVAQDVRLFTGTVRDNLSFFDPEVTDARIRAALADLGLSEWFESLPDGLDTPLSAEGQRVSAGEAQLLAFARVFLRDPKVIVLDEASSRLDPTTERLIERGVDRLIAGRTAIVIAHRLATVQRADDILILEDGAIREFGPRVALAADAGSRFSSLLSASLA